MLSNESDLQKQNNFHQIQEIFFDYLDNVKYKGIFGIAKFSSVYYNLLPIQKIKLQELLKTALEDFLGTGAILSLGIAYPAEIIQCIYTKRKNTIDISKWNLYSEEYKHINDMLQEIGHKLASQFDGILIPPTTETPAELVKNVKDYYPHTISHRVVAEYAGLGWRGKNELIITEKYGPAVRFTSILINMPLFHGKKIENNCGECTACLEACEFLNNKNTLVDYREQCRKYIMSLGLTYDVCGKCIKACYNKYFVERHR